MQGPCTTVPSSEYNSWSMCGTDASRCCTGKKLNNSPALKRVQRAGGFQEANHQGVSSSAPVLHTASRFMLRALTPPDMQKLSASLPSEAHHSFPHKLPPLDRQLVQGGERCCSRAEPTGLMSPATPGSDLFDAIPQVPHNTAGLHSQWQAAAGWLGAWPVKPSLRLPTLQVHQAVPKLTSRAGISQQKWHPENPIL